MRVESYITASRTYKNCCPNNGICIIVFINRITELAELASSFDPHHIYTPNRVKAGLSHDQEAWRHTHSCMSAQKFDHTGSSGPPADTDVATVVITPSTAT